MCDYIVFCFHAFMEEVLPNPDVICYLPTLNPCSRHVTIQTVLFIKLFYIFVFKQCIIYIYSRCVLLENAFDKSTIIVLFMQSYGTC